jgi:C-terminal processing protease CtpA/Prc
MSLCQRIVFCYRSVVSIVSFQFSEDPAWNGFSEAVAAAKENAPAIVFDFRGNGGGDDSTGRKMARILYGQDFPSPVEKIVKSQTPATFAIGVSGIRLRILRMKRSGVAVPDYLQIRLQEKLREYHEAKSGLLSTEAEKLMSGLPFNQSKAYTKPIYLLVDRGCASSCESTVELFEDHPFAKMVGENTGGFVHFGNTGSVVLPNSKIVLSMATNYWKRRNGFFEKSGYAPKIRVPYGSDALEYALLDLQRTYEKQSP